MAQNFYETFKVHLTTMMQYSSTQASKKGGQMLEHWGHLRAARCRDIRRLQTCI